MQIAVQNVRHVLFSLHGVSAILNYCIQQREQCKSELSLTSAIASYHFNTSDQFQINLKEMQGMKFFF